MAFLRHAAIQAPHLMHFAASITWGCLISPEIAFTGQPRLHKPQPTHSVGSIEYDTSALQTPAGHFLSRTCAMYSSLKYLSVESTGFGAVCPKPHSEFSFM